MNGNHPMTHCTSETGLKYKEEGTMQLESWESFLLPYMSQIELLGEIPLTPSQHADLEAAISGLLTERGLTKATSLLRQQYPASFVTYLAFKAALNDERAFWKEVARAMGQKDHQLFFQKRTHWGQLFKEIVASFPNLPRFEGISGHEYVTAIRLHGGIPAFSLPDFFRFVLCPSVEEPRYASMDDGEALDNLVHGSRTETSADDVVRYFFQYGGDPALGFFSKCRRMAKVAQDGGILPAPEKLGLRPYIVEAFEDYLQNPPEEGAHHKRPRLYFCPNPPSFRIVLPPQPLHVNLSRRLLIARLLAGTTEEILAEKSGIQPHNDVHPLDTPEVEWIVEQPVDSVRVELLAGEDVQPICSYGVRLLPPDGAPPLLAFRYEDGSAHSLSSALPAAVFWLLWPSGVELRFGGSARREEDLDLYGALWAGWQGAAWDLEHVDRIRLLRDGEDICPPIPVKATDEPSLRAELVHPQCLPVDEMPLYKEPPEIALPLRDSHRLEEELASWEVCLESEGPAIPSGKWKAKGSDLPHRLEDEGGPALLSVREWLGGAPAGAYGVTLLRDGRREARFSFRVCSGLSIEGLEPYYLPEEQGDSAAYFQVLLADATGWKLAVCPAGVECCSTAGGWLVRVPGDSDNAQMLLEHDTEAGPCRICLSIAIPRPRWDLFLEPDTGRGLGQSLIKLPLDELLQADLAKGHPRLSLSMPLYDCPPPEVRLELWVPADGSPLQVVQAPSLSRKGADFDLSTYFDTLRDRSNEPVFELCLSFFDDQRNTSSRIPVLRLERALNIHAVYFNGLPEGHPRLHWHEPHPLRYRRVFIWSLWQPWQDPLELRIPDDAMPSDIGGAGWWMYDIPEDISLPRSAYWLYFRVVPPYEEYRPPALPPAAALRADTIKSQKRLDDIAAQLQDAPPGRAFALHFEKLCIERDLGDPLVAEEEIRWMLSHWREAHPIYLEALQRWLGRYDDPWNRQAFLIEMFSEEKLLELRGQPENFVEKYLSNVCDVPHLRPGSARLVLKLSRSPEVILCALKSLAQTEPEEVGSLFWQELKEGRLSITDVARSLAQDAAFARSVLSCPAPPDLRRALLEQIGREPDCDLPEFVVKSGYYVLFDCGWGQIKEIVDHSQGVSSFLLGEEEPLLRVELLHWPDQRVELDLANKAFTLIGRGGAYQCACGRFVALNDDETKWDKHGETCGSSKGERRPVPAVLPLASAPKFFANPPANPFETKGSE